MLNTPDFASSMPVEPLSSLSLSTPTLPDTAGLGMADTGAGGDLLPRLLAFTAQWWADFAGYFAFDPALLSTPDMLARLMLQLALLFGSAFFSGSETALFSLSRLDLQQLRRLQHPHIDRLQALLDQPRRLIISVLCGNQLINIAAVANMTGILVTLYGDERAGVINVFVMVPVLLLFGEVTPKTIAISNPVRVSANLVAPLMTLWVRLVTPLRALLRLVSDNVTTWFVGHEKAPENILQIDEFRTLVDEVANDGEIQASERTLIYHLLDAGATEIVEIMTPRTRMAFIDGDSTLTEALERFRALRHSRVPVFRGQIDHLIGFLHLEDVLPLVLDAPDLSNKQLDDLLRPLVVAPPTKRVDEMFDFFQANQTQAALVIDEFGGVEGIVTIRDVLTFIFGHLSGEAKGQALYHERDENVYDVPGDMKLTDFQNLTNFGIWDPRMTTIAGVAFRHLDRLPRVGDRVSIEDCTLEVLQLEGLRIAQVRVSRGRASQDSRPEPIPDIAPPMAEDDERSRQHPKQADTAE